MSAPTARGSDSVVLRLVTSEALKEPEQDAMPMCWICGKPDTMPGPRQQKRVMVELTIDGNSVNAHQSCAIDEGYLKPERKDGRAPSRERSGPSW